MGGERLLRRKRHVEDEPYLDEYGPGLWWLPTGTDGVIGEKARGLQAIELSCSSSFKDWWAVNWSGRQETRLGSCLSKSDV